jgi:hypothetical protein
MSDLVVPDSKAEKNVTKNDRAMHARGSCDMCKFCGIMSGASKEVTFVCRYNPPTVTAAAIPQGNGVGWAAAGFFPPVSRLDWCRCFEPVLQ